jgi:hypothetical protein
VRAAWKIATTLLLCLLLPVVLLIDLILAGVGTGGLELTEKVGRALRKVWRA